MIEAGVIYVGRAVSFMESAHLGHYQLRFRTPMGAVMVTKGEGAATVTGLGVNDSNPDIVDAFEDNPYESNPQKKWLQAAVISGTAEDGKQYVIETTGTVHGFAFDVSAGIQVRQEVVVRIIVGLSASVVKAALTA